MLGCETYFQPKGEHIDSQYKMMSMAHNNSHSDQSGDQGAVGPHSQWGYGTMPHGMPAMPAMPGMPPGMPFPPEAAAAMFAQMPPLPPMPQGYNPYHHQQPPQQQMAHPEQQQQQPHSHGYPGMQAMPSFQPQKGDHLVYNPPPVSPPPQRERFSYTRYQLELLNNIYDVIRYPNPMQKQLIGKRVGITRDQVKIWFQNRRRKDVTGKSKDMDMSGPQMVPDTIMEGVLSELQTFKNDPKGKKTKGSAATKAPARKRKRDSDEESSFDASEPYKKMGHFMSGDELSNTSMDNSINSAEASSNQEAYNLSKQGSPVPLPSLPLLQQECAQRDQNSPSECYERDEDKSPEPYPVSITRVNPQRSSDTTDSPAPNVITPSPKVQPPNIESPLNQYASHGTPVQPIVAPGSQFNNPAALEYDCHDENPDPDSPGSDSSLGTENSAQENTVLPQSEPIALIAKSSYLPATPLSLDLPTDLSTTAPTPCVIQPEFPVRESFSIDNLHTPAPPHVQEDSPPGANTTPSSNTNETPESSPTSNSSYHDTSVPPSSSHLSSLVSWQPSHAAAAVLPPVFHHQPPGAMHSKDPNNDDSNDFSHFQSQKENMTPDSQKDALALQKEAMAQAFQMGQVFPFPMLAENPMMLSSMPGMQMPQCDPSSMFRDPYQPYMISTYSNPYFDPGAMQAFQQQADTQKQGI